MLTQVIRLQTNKKIFVMNVFYFIFFLSMYTIVDSFNMSYAAMVENYGLFLPLINIVINILMALLSMTMMGLTTAQFQLSGHESKGSNLTFASIFFGILTYGCTPCVISFFATFGITFSVIALPFAGLPYKFISLALLILGVFWVIRSIKTSTCRVDLSEKVTIEKPHL
jgi:hypothetical protein